MWMRLPLSLEGSGAIRMIMVAAAKFWLAQGRRESPPCYVGFGRTCGESVPVRRLHQGVVG
jgi:hypothetical protein